MENQVQYGGFWIRQVAGLIDTIAFGIMYYLIMLAFPDSGQYYFAMAVYHSFAMLYYIGFTMSKWQGTPGQKALGLKVVTKNLQKPGLATVIWRNILFMLPGLPIIIHTYSVNAEEYFQKLERETSAFENDPEAMGQYLSNNPEIINFFLVFMGATALTLLVALVWFISIAFTKQKTGVHDLLSKTRVIHG